MSSSRKIYLAYPRGFCAGVRRSLETVEKALAVHGAPVYVLHEIVHNDFVVESLKKRGVIFVESLDEVPPKSPLIFSAHGVPLSVEEEACQKNLRVIDATCPLVKKIHRKASELERKDYKIVLIGHRRHPEIKGTSGRLKTAPSVIENIQEAKAFHEHPSDIRQIACLSQTTLNVEETKDIIDELKKNYPNLTESDGICYATSNRQNAVKKLLEYCDTVIISGSPKSSNSTRLKELAEKAGRKAFLAGRASSLKAEDFADSVSIGISAGASAPECLLEESIAFLRSIGWDCEPEEVRAAEENTVFPLPEI